MVVSGGTPPFECSVCGPRDREIRNCCNHKGLSEKGRAVTWYTEDIIDEHRKGSAHKVFTLGDIRLYECPLSYITHETWEILRMVYIVRHYGHLPFDGGWGNQPYWFVEAMEIFQVETSCRKSPSEEPIR